MITVLGWIHKANQCRQEFSRALSSEAQQELLLGVAKVTAACFVAHLFLGRLGPILILGALSGYSIQLWSENKEQSKNIQTLLKTNQTMQTVNTELAAKLTTLEGSLSEMQNILSDLKRNNKDHAAQLKALAKLEETLTATTTRFELIHSWMEDSKESLGDKITHLIEKLTGLEMNQTVVSHINTLATTSKNLGEVQATHTALQSEVKELEKVRDEIKTCITDLSSEISKLKGSHSQEFSKLTELFEKYLKKMPGAIPAAS